MKAKDLMIPVSDCAKVAEDRSIFDAVTMLDAWRQRFDHSEYRPRVVLVYDKDFKIVGSLRHVDMLRAFTAQKSSLSSPSNAPNAARSTPASASASIDEQTTVWTDVLRHLYEASHDVLVKDAVYYYHADEYIDEDATVEEALARLTAGPYLNLVVMSGDATVGIVRLSDMFSLVCREIKRSGMR